MLLVGGNHAGTQFTTAAACILKDLTMFLMNGCILPESYSLVFAAPSHMLLIW